MQIPNIKNLEHIKNPSVDVVALRKSLSQYGYDHVLNELPDTCDQRAAMGRLVEMGPELPADGSADIGQAKQPTPEEFGALVAAAQAVTAEHRQVLLARVREHAYNEESPHRVMAMEALSPIDDAAAAWVKDHQKQLQQNIQVLNSGAQIRGCCGED